MANIKKVNVIGVGPNSRLLKEYKNTLHALSTEQWEASIGLILGDGSIQTQNKGKKIIVINKESYPLPLQSLCGGSLEN